MRRLLIHRDDADVRGQRNPAVRGSYSITGRTAPTAAAAAMQPSKQGQPSTLSSMSSHCPRSLSRRVSLPAQMGTCQSADWVRAACRGLKSTTGAVNIYDDDDDDDNVKKYFCNANNKNKRRAFRFVAL